jgi:hypothetical protein
MAEKRNQNTRVYGQAVKGERRIGPDPLQIRGLSPEQRAKRERDTLASYETWKREREARLSRNKRL